MIRQISEDFAIKVFFVTGVFWGKKSGHISDNNRDWFKIQIATGMIHHRLIFDDIKYII